MNVGRGANIVVDASAFVKRSVCRRWPRLIRERDARMVVCGRLMGEYARHIGKGGLSPRYMHILLNGLRREGRLIDRKEEELVSVAPPDDEDAHVINLAKTTNAIIITDDKKLKEEKAPSYGLKAFYLHEFLRDC